MYEYQAEQALMKVRVRSTDKNSNGLYYWSLEDNTVETVATARIFAGFFNLSALLSGMPRIIYFDGTNTADYGVSVLNVKGRWEIPEGEEITSTIPALDGVYYHHTKLNERILEVKCLLMQDSMSALAAAQRKLNSLLNPKKGECEIRFDDEFIYLYKGRYRGKSVEETGSKYEIFTLTFACSKPFVYSESQYYRTENIVSLENRGTQKAPLRLTVSGPASFPVITLGENSIYINTVLNSSSDQFVIDTETKEVTLNGAPAAHLAEGAFLMLEPGPSDMYISDGVLEVEFSEMWL